MLCDPRWARRRQTSHTEKVLAHEADWAQQHPSPPRGAPQVREGGIQHGQLLQHGGAHFQHCPAMLRLEEGTGEARMSPRALPNPPSGLAPLKAPQPRAVTQDVQTGGVCVPLPPVFSWGPSALMESTQLSLHEGSAPPGSPAQAAHRSRAPVSLPPLAPPAIDGTLPQRPPPPPCSLHWGPPPAQPSWPHLTAVSEFLDVGAGIRAQLILIGSPKSQGTVGGHFGAGVGDILVGRDTEQTQEGELDHTNRGALCIHVRELQRDAGRVTAGLGSSCRGAAESGFSTVRCEPEAMSVIVFKGRERHIPGRHIRGEDSRALAKDSRHHQALRGPCQE